MTKYRLVSCHYQDEEVAQIINSQLPVEFDFEVYDLKKDVIVVQVAQNNYFDYSYIKMLKDSLEGMAKSFKSAKLIMILPDGLQFCELEEMPNNE